MHKLCIYTCLNTTPNYIYVICEPVSRSYWVIFCEWNFNCISYVCVVCSPDLIDVTYKPVTTQLIHLLVLYYIALGLLDQIIALFAWLISHQPTVFFSYNKLATSNPSAVFFSHNKSASATGQTNRLNVCASLCALFSISAVYVLHHIDILGTILVSSALRYVKKFNEIYLLIQ
jgi:hypothetical protein